MLEETLLERIRSLGKNPGEKAVLDIQARMNSIVKHLKRMLNTRQGSVLIAEDYGMPDFTNYPGDDISEIAKELELALKHSILKYEPRLDKVAIRFEPGAEDILSLRFRLEASVFADRDRKIPVVFETVVRAGGNVEIENAGN